MTIASEAIQEQIAEVFDDLLPSLENADLVVRSNGTENAYGEPIGETESLTPIFLHLDGEDRTARIASAGDVGPISVRFFAKSTVTINEGDRIRFDGNDYLVRFIQKRSIADHHIYWEGRMQKIQGN